jgi:hypothetical protein
VHGLLGEECQDGGADVAAAGATAPAVGATSAGTGAEALTGRDGTPAVRVVPAAERSAGVAAAGSAAAGEGVLVHGVHGVLLRTVDVL